jgi:hypothetical protein
MSSDDLTVIWYTYTTISQTLASAFGFLTAVSLYQMQSLSRQLEWRATDYLLNEINTPPGQGSQPTIFIRTGRFNAFRKHIQVYGFRDDGDAGRKAAQQEVLNVFDTLLADFNAIKHGLRASLAPTVCTIILSTLFLCITNEHILCSFWPAWIPCFCIVLAFIYCIVQYVHLAETIILDDGFERLKRWLRPNQQQETE